MNDTSEAFCSSLIIVFLAMGIGISLNRLVGVILTGVGCIDIIVVKLHENTVITPYFVIILPLVIGVVAFCSFIFRGHLDRLILHLDGRNKHLQRLKSPVPELRLREKGITRAEWRCIEGLQNGQMTKEIARAEECSESAIQGRLGSIYKKLGVKDRAELMLFLGRHTVIWESEEPDQVPGGPA
jgi:DNA-binding CsgD family transcriptional regulator